mgnify:CR=1 FL=1
MKIALNNVILNSKGEVRITLFPAKRIKELRENMNVSQGKLANDLLIGQSTMSEYENGVKQPPISVLIKIADYFNVSLDYLTGRTNVKTTIDNLQEKLITESGKKININDLLNLDSEEKEALIDLIKIFKKHNLPRNIKPTKLK